MESPDNTTDQIGGPCAEEILLEAYNMKWETIELRHQRLKKMWQRIILSKKMEQEYRRCQRQLRRRERREQEKEAREQAKFEREEALRHQREKEAREQAKCERKEALRRQRKEKRAEVEKQKKQKKVAGSGTQTVEDENVPLQSKTANKTKLKMIKTKLQPEKVKKPKPKRIAPISVPSLRPKDDESVTDENQNELGRHDSSLSELPELPDDGLLNLLSLDKDSDSDDEPSMVSLILPAVHDSPKPLPLEKKKSTPQKRFAKKRGGTPLDFDFTNAEAKRQAKAAEAARDEHRGSDEDDAEPEPMPVPSASIPKKRLKRRKKEVAKDRQRANGVDASGGKMLMAAMANTTIAVKPKKGVASDEATTGTNIIQKKTIENANGPRTKTKSKNVQLSAQGEGKTPGLSSKKTTNGKTETMSIKQRLANVELLAQMNKMQDMNTPKILGKKTQKTQKQGVAKTLAAKRAEIRKMLSSGTEEADASRPDQMIEEGDLNISLNSSGLISGYDSPENALTRKRPRAAVQEDVTPTKKLQFLEITKRLTKSPMPRFLRTPTPLTSPMVPSAFINPKAASPAPRAASARNTAPSDHGARHMNSAPVRPKKTINANRFGVPIGGTSVGSGGGSFSMFDAFVNSGTGEAIPRLKTKARGNG